MGARNIGTRESSKAPPNTVTIRYRDGDRDTRSVNQAKPYDWTIGSQVECNWEGKGTWYPGVIAGVEALAINYDDGDKEASTAGKCRSK